MFSWRNKKNINTFGLKKSTLTSAMFSPQKHVYVLSSHKKCLSEGILMSTTTYVFCGEIKTIRAQLFEINDVVS